MVDLTILFYSAPTVHHPQFQYDLVEDGRVLTNEQLLYNLSTGKTIYIITTIQDNFMVKS